MCEEQRPLGFGHVLKAVRQVAFSEGDYTFLTPD